jgi:hypothetical protein
VCVCVFEVCVLNDEIICIMSILKYDEFKKHNFLYIYIYDTNVYTWLGSIPSYIKCQLNNLILLIV